jgi:hypothetical protein|tara:strand:+ start:1426 stop:1956 length:531 start_codon:yes stop_codon:yes gene_type:complete
MNIKSMIVNEYTVGGSLLLVGAGFFSTRFTDALSYELFSLPSGIPMIGGASVTVGRVVGLVPLSLGLAFLFGKIRPVTSRIPVVDKVMDIADNLVAEVSMPVASEVQGAETVDHINPTEVSADNDEEVVLEAETLAPAKMKWTTAVSKARKDLGIEGFTAVKKGTALYDKAKSYMN